MKPLVLENVKNFDIGQIEKSGQCFRLQKHREKDTWELVAFGHYLKLRQEKGSTKVEFFCSETEFESLWKGYFDLECDYQKYIDRIDTKDTYLMAAAKEGNGIRLLRQEPWEILISFVISQNNNIPRIRKSIDTLCRCYGEKQVTKEGDIWYTFPKPESLTDLEGLKQAGLGYRDKYIQRIAKEVAEGSIDLQKLSDDTLSDKELEDYLKGIYGIGIKVANCIMLFGCHRLDCVPMDTWMNKVIQQNYNGSFPIDRYQGCSGVIQQYLFHYAANKL
jgi:N-glycosylase/DNA lyase